MTILDELKKAVSEYHCDFKKHDMAGVIVSHKKKRSREDKEC